MNRMVMRVIWGPTILGLPYNATNVWYEFGHVCAFEDLVMACYILSFGIDRDVEVGVFVGLESVDDLVHNIGVSNFGKVFFICWFEHIVGVAKCLVCCLSRYCNVKLDGNNHHKCNKWPYKTSAFPTSWTKQTTRLHHIQPLRYKKLGPTIAQHCTLQH